jgi:endonuclease III
MPRSLARWVHQQLLRHYGRPMWDCRNEPLEELVATVLSQHTSDVNSDRAFAGLRAAFDSWEAVRDAPPPRLEEAIRSGGLAVVKAARIQAVLRALTDADGVVRLPSPITREFLVTLPGVGIKTASCVLLFGAGIAAIPVDTHVHRVALRVGLVPQRSSPEIATSALEAEIPPKDQYAFHINLIRHGREVCKAQRPRCGICVLRKRCAYVMSP